MKFGLRSKYLSAFWDDLIIGFDSGLCLVENILKMKNV